MFDYAEVLLPLQGKVDDRRKYDQRLACRCGSNALSQFYLLLGTAMKSL